MLCATHSPHHTLNSLSSRSAPVEKLAFVAEFSYRDLIMTNFNIDAVCILPAFGRFVMDLEGPMINAPPVWRRGRRVFCYGKQQNLLFKKFMDSEVGDYDYGMKLMEDVLITIALGYGNPTKTGTTLALLNFIKLRLGDEPLLSGERIEFVMLVLEMLGEEIFYGSE